MEKALMSVFEAHAYTFMERVSQEFGIHQDQLLEIWEETKKNKKISKKKKFSKTERKKTAYQVFSDRHRKKLKEDGLSFGDIAKELGRRWKAMTDKEKEAYKKEDQPAPMVISSDQEEGEQEISDTIEEKASEEDKSGPDKMESVSLPVVVKKEKKEPPPSDFTTPEEIAMWNEIREIKLLQLRAICSQNGLQTSTKRRDMILAIALHRLSEA